MLSKGAIFLIIMVEGIDRIGKGTLCSHLEEHHDFSIVHFGRPEGSTDSERAMFQKGTFDRMFRMVKSLHGQSARIVFDRAHLGEMVYGPLYRPNSGVDESYVLDMEEGCEEVLLILMVHRDPMKMTKDRDDGESFDPSKCEDEQDQFIAAFNKSSLNKELLDVTNMNINQVKSWIDERIENWLI